jgi:hypothetical protein
MITAFRSAIDLLRAALAEADGDLPGVTVAGVLLMVLSVGPEWYLKDEAAIVMIASLAGFVAQYWLTRRALDRHGLRHGRGVVALYFGMCLASGLGIVLGLVLLILPGLWLAARWIAAGPVLFCEDVGAIDALRRSASLTEGRVLPIMIALVLASVPVLLVIGPAFVRDEYDMATSIIENTALTISQMLAWYVAVVVYRAGIAPSAPTDA